jgi:hypothetical protein
MILFVAIGAVPRHVTAALAQARRADPDSPIVLLQDRAPRALRRRAHALRVDLADLELLRRDERWAAFDQRRDRRHRFRQGFWRHTTGRFFAMRAFMERESLDQATHLEHDVLLYASARALGSSPAFRDPKLSTVFENSTRAIPGIVRIGARAALDAFVDGILAEPASDEAVRFATDMERFALFRRAAPALVGDLPTLPPSDEDAPHHQTRSLFDRNAAPIPLPEGGWLFDGARFGQYLGGIDPRNERYLVRRWLRRQHGTLGHPNGFINESCIDDPSQYRYVVLAPMSLPVPAVVVGSRRYPLATLHVHSKQLDRFGSGALEGLAQSC